MAGNDNKLVTLADLGAAYTALSATATTSANGMMSSTDKTKLDGIASGAQVNPTIVNGLTETTAGSVLDATQGKALKDDVDSKLSKDFSTYTIATTPYNNNTLIPLRLGNDNLVTDFGTLSTQLGGGGGTSQGALVHYTAQYGPFGTSGQSSTLNTTVNDSNVTADMCVLKAVFSNPSAQTSDWTVTCSHNGTTGQVTFQGGITGTTNVTLYFGVAMTAAPSLLVNLGSNNSDNILKASVSPGVTGVLGLANGGTGVSANSNGALLTALNAFGKSSASGTITDANNTDLYGSRFFQASACSNLPTSTSGEYYQVEFMGTCQLAFKYSDSGITEAYVRNYVNNQWYPWVDISRSKVYGKTDSIIGGTASGTPYIQKYTNANNIQRIQLDSDEPNYWKNTDGTWTNQRLLVHVGKKTGTGENNYGIIYLPILSTNSTVISAYAIGGVQPEINKSAEYQWYVADNSFKGVQKTIIYTYINTPYSSI